MWVCVDHGPIVSGRRCLQFACDGDLQVVETTLPTGVPVVLVTVSGELDHATAGAVDEALARALAARPGLLVVDVGDLGFCGVHGLASLSRAAREAEAQGVRFGVNGLSSWLARVWALFDGTQPLSYAGAGSIVIAAVTEAVRAAPIGAPSR